MKKHLVSVTFDPLHISGPRVEPYTFVGFVTGLEVQGKVVVDPIKIHKAIFGPVPQYLQITYG